MSANESNIRDVSKRRSLQSLQCISNNNKLLTRNINVKPIERQNKSSKKETKSSITQYMTRSDAIDCDLKYWKSLAKEREKALEIALKENEELVTENELLKQENQHLTQLAEEGIRLKDLIQEYL